MLGGLLNRMKAEINHFTDLNLPGYLTVLLYNFKSPIVEILQMHQISLEAKLNAHFGPQYNIIFIW